MATSASGATSTFDLASIERIEREAFLAYFSVVPLDVATNFGIRAEVIDGCLHLAAREIPLYKWNRVVGLGIVRPATETQLDAAIEWSRRYADPGFAIQVAPGAMPLRLDGWLADRGFQPDGNGWAQLVRDSSPVVEPSVATSLEVREIGADEADTFGAICSEVFEYPAGVEDWIAVMVRHPQVRAYVAYDRTTPVGTGLMYVSEGWAWIGFGGVLAGHRGRGAQSALTLHRLTDGIAMGVQGFVTETSYPLPGEERDHPSYRNGLRAGYKLAYVRPNYRALGRSTP